MATSLAGENLARNNYPDGQSVSVAMSAFMSSPAHRVNVLEAKFSASASAWRWAPTA